MTNKAYIVVNEQQVDEISKMLGINLTKMLVFPYVAYVDNVNSSLMYGGVGSIKNEKIAFDGRKEERMGDKYVVSQKFMNELERWKDTLSTYNEPGYFIDMKNINDLPDIVNIWWGADISNKESNNRLIAIIRWVNGEDVFEVEKPKKWVVRSKDADTLGRYGYLDCYDYAITENTYKPYHATKFDTKEEAQEWANSHQEVIEVE